MLENVSAHAVAVVDCKHFLGNIAPHKQQNYSVLLISVLGSVRSFEDKNDICSDALVFLVDWAIVSGKRMNVPNRFEFGDECLLVLICHFSHFKLKLDQQLHKSTAALGFLCDAHNAAPFNTRLTYTQPKHPLNYKSFCCCRQCYRRRRRCCHSMHRQKIIPLQLFTFCSIGNSSIEKTSVCNVRTLNAMNCFRFRVHTPLRSHCAVHCNSVRCAVAGT